MRSTVERAAVRSAVAADAPMANRRVSGGGRGNAGHGARSRVERDVLALPSGRAAAEHDGAGAALRRCEHAARRARRASTDATVERGRSAHARAGGGGRPAFPAHARPAADGPELSPRVHRPVRVAGRSDRHRRRTRPIRRCRASCNAWRDARSMRGVSRPRSAPGRPPPSRRILR